MGVSIEAQVLKDGLVKYFVDEEMSQAYKDLQTGFSLKKVFILIWQGIEAVEKLAQDAEMAKAGGKKKEALVSWLDDAVKFTGWIRWAELVDGKLFAAAIDGMIAFTNLRFGNDWITKWSKYI